MTDTGYNLAVQRPRAATERRADYTCSTAVVHDENARLIGGTPGTLACSPPWPTWPGSRPGG